MLVLKANFTGISKLCEVRRKAWGPARDTGILEAFASHCEWSLTMTGFGDAPAFRAAITTHPKRRKGLCGAVRAVVCKEGPSKPWNTTLQVYLLRNLTPVPAAPSTAAMLPCKIVVKDTATRLPSACLQGKVSAMTPSEIRPRKQPVYHHFSCFLLLI